MLCVTERHVASEFSEVRRRPALHDDVHEEPRLLLAVSGPDLAVHRECEKVRARQLRIAWILARPFSQCVGCAIDVADEPRVGRARTGADRVVTQDIVDAEKAQLARSKILVGWGLRTRRPRRRGDTADRCGRSEGPGERRGHHQREKDSLCVQSQKSVPNSKGGNTLTLARLGAGDKQTRLNIGLPETWESTDLVVRTVFKTAEAFARGLLGSIPRLSRHFALNARYIKVWWRARFSGALTSH